MSAQQVRRQRSCRWLLIARNGEVFALGFFAGGFVEFEFVDTERVPGGGVGGVASYSAAVGVVEESGFGTVDTANCSGNQCKS